MHTLENGAVTSIASIMSVVFWLSMQDLPWLTFCHRKTPRKNSILAIFNYRQELRRTHANGGNILDLDPARLGFGSYLQSPVITLGFNMRAHSSTAKAG
ncbi:hypothetical protein D9757_006727 [Collybiopsis confluens]|uniref:Uncharacterized protein n=1 Tax=Collybiopsis confluens TaxID=2823264 RepID=A0A8H5M9K1_9AGAR|nr:hypothetical protein D9757_006727 [Collybiopsis confluens]